MRKSAKNKPVNIKAVAAAAGMSVASVSRALRDDPRVKLVTREKLKALCDSMGYRPSPIAAHLAGGRTGMLAMLVPCAKNPIYAAMIEAVIQTAGKMDYGVTIAYGGGSVESERRIIHSLHHAHADGFIFIPRFLLANANEIAAFSEDRRRRPFIVRVLDSDVIEFNQTDRVLVDFYKAAFDATAWLISQGHREIFYLGMGSNISRNSRTGGFTDAMLEAGLTVSRQQLVGCGENIESAYRAALEYLTNHRPTAVVVYSDYNAFGLLRAAGELGLKIPDDLSVISFDNIELSAYGYVPLTTMAQPIEEIAETMVNRICRRLKNPQLPIECIRYGLKLVHRDSVKSLL